MWNSYKMKDCIKCNQKINVTKKFYLVWYARASFWSFDIRIVLLMYI